MGGARRWGWGGAPILVSLCIEKLHVCAKCSHMREHAGAVLVTPDGKWPAADQEDALEAALQKCGIKKWELYRVDNSSTLEAPLTIPEGPMKTLKPETI